MFTRKGDEGVDRNNCDQWLSDFKKTVVLPPEANHDRLGYWLPTVQNFIDAIKKCHHSACGPDLIPFEAFKAIPEEAAKVLHSVATCMLDTSSPHKVPDWFNMAYLVRLPKTQPRAMSNMGMYMNLLT